MIEPLKFSFTVACNRQHAFDVWTSRTTSWWPKDHTVSGDPEVNVTIEPFIGGRIFESTPTGREHDWGQIVAWEPPNRFAYNWFITTDASNASLVEVEFEDVGAGTRIDILHSGWERLGAGPEWRSRNQRGWNALIPRIVEACQVPAA